MNGKRGDGFNYRALVEKSLKAVDGVRTLLQSHELSDSHSCLLLTDGKLDVGRSP